MNSFLFEYLILSCDAELNFQHHYSSLQCHVILQKKNFLITIRL